MEAGGFGDRLILIIFRKEWFGVVNIEGGVGVEQLLDGLGLLRFGVCKRPQRLWPGWSSCRNPDPVLTHLRMDHTSSVTQR